MSNNTPSHSTLFSVFLALLLLAPGQAVAGTNTHSTPSISEDIDWSSPQAQETTTNNSSQSQHENPDEVDKKGELSDVQRWLAGRLGSQLGSSTVKLSQGEYQQAKSVLGDDYNSKLTRYVDVAGETDSKKDDQTAKQFQQAKENQRQYASSVQQFRQTYNKYQTARQNGNDERARELARRLDRLQSQINHTGNNLTKNYKNISNTTQADLQKETGTVNNITQNVTQQQAEVQEQEFTETELTTDVNTTEIAYRDPLDVSGQLTSDNGTELANRTILLKLRPGRVIKTKTSEVGTFSFVARPRKLPLGPNTVTVQYAPKNSSVYLGSNSTTNVSVHQTETTIELQNTTKTAAYNETINVSGRVTAVDRGVTNVPVTVLVDGVQITTVNTTENGSFAASAALPAKINPGSKDIRVAVPLSDQALASTNATAPFTVQPTGTTLNITNVNQTGQQLMITGALTTASGEPVPNKVVALQLNGQQLTTVMTNAHGQYRANITIPEAVLNSDKSTAKLSALYSGRGANLNKSQASSQVPLPASEKESDSLFSQTTYLLASLLGLGLLGIAALMRTGLLTRSSETDSTPSDTTASKSPANTEQDPEPEPKPDQFAETLLDRANSALSDGNREQAVELAYAAARDSLTTTVDVDPKATHWEFYTACQEANIADENLERLADLTEAYEHAAFAATSTSSMAAETAIEHATSLVETRS
ncbi:hypothetical protein [Halomicrococcus sp. NG-SE-24]|uniref:hypothetical protein n=1 Tax=Halomicrococcus sp. NG-SE-24 TaxID=3436928 RepID=UPI003D98BF96